MDGQNIPSIFINKIILKSIIIRSKAGNLFDPNGLFNRFNRSRGTRTQPDY